MLGNLGAAEMGNLGAAEIGFSPGDAGESFLEAELCAGSCSSCEISA